MGSPARESIGEQPVIPTTRGGHLNGQISRADQGEVSGPATPSVSFHWLHWLSSSGCRRYQRWSRSTPIQRDQFLSQTS